MIVLALYNIVCFCKIGTVALVEVGEASQTVKIEMVKFIIRAAVKYYKN